MIKMQGWKRSDWWDDTNLTWIDPSPNMNSLPAALLYPGTCLLESTRNFSVGRGSHLAYEQIGADWLDGRKLAEFLNNRSIPGVRAYPMLFEPEAYHFAGQMIDGVRFIITDRNSFNSVSLGLEIIYALEKLYPGKIDISVNGRLIGSKAVIEALAAGDDPKEIERAYNPDLKQFLRLRQKYLLYQ